MINVTVTYKDKTNLKTFEKEPVAQELYPSQENVSFSGDFLILNQKNLSTILRLNDISTIAYQAVEQAPNATAEVNNG